MWKVVLKIWCEILCPQLPGRTENHEKCESG